MTVKRILIVEDEAGLRQIIQFSLEAVAGWEVLTAASGKEGLMIAEAEQPDGILLDVMMPDMDGDETFKRLQNNPTTKDIPTIFLTSKASVSEQQELLDLGVAGAIAKPIKPRDLVEKICKILHWQA
ncbi:response regulator [Waterburya agarophytonicola K14]|uniref:Response regulator n=1 Tax=Waterburya agarophytonicola KI4 TaxID=2874699 RepID=A0A964BLE7_9CYAN|nr:response regulator [Waterburya agarophytonicola]MCC0175548.1 response regulator [Waterburya agarophytonicola KI4]